MDLEFDAEEAQRFLPLVGYSNYKGLEFRFLSDKNAFSVWPEDGDPPWELCKKATRAGYSISYVACVRGDGRRGDKISVIQANFLWADIDAQAFDAKDIVHGKELALEHLDRVLPPEQSPSILIDSGHGFHALWLLERPWAFDMDGSIEMFELLLRRLAKRLKADRSSAEAARVLRLPGSVNFKDKDNPCLCKIVRINH